LKGKSLGVQSIGGGVWTFSMLALDRWGLVPERDKILFRILSDQAVIAQGLISGTVDAAYLGYTFSKAVQRQGFRVLEDLAKTDIPYQGIGIVARKSFLEQSPDIAERMLKALSRSIAYYQDPANRQHRGYSNPMAAAPAQRGRGGGLRSRPIAIRQADIPHYRWSAQHVAHSRAH
jgi:ABC-type nitrate/sulfonate/bicarbonate transport system substrate-binding protein